MADAGIDAGYTMSSGTGDASDSAPEASANVVSPGVPAGWMEFTDYAPECGFYVPSSTATLPAPIEWAPCDSAVQPVGIGCRQIKVTWQGPPNNNPVGFMLNQAWISPSGVYTMAIARGFPGMTYYLVADADGPVHSALLATKETQCRPFPEDLRDGRVVYKVYETDATGALSEYGGGALVSNLDDLKPRAYLRFHDRVAHSYLVGLPGVLEVLSAPNAFVLHDWTNPSTALMTWSSAQDNGLQEIPSAFEGHALFWQATSDLTSMIEDWTEDAGVQNLISFGNDMTQGAGSFGADPTDLVWLHGFGRGPDSGITFPAAEYVTSPFATSPGQLVPRRLTSENPGGLGTGLMQIGCGFAAWEPVLGLRVLRLSDGVSWLLPNPQGASWRWIEPMAITCSDLFAVVQFQSDGGWTSNVARVDLSSLGPGTPAN